MAFGSGGEGAPRPGPDGAERLLNVREVAERLGVCTTTVYGLCTRGELTGASAASAGRSSST